MAHTQNEVIRLAEHEADIHYQEGRSNGHWNNNQKYSDQTPGLEWSDWMAWCATFVVWLHHRAGDRHRVPVTASCLNGVSTYRKWGRFSYYPAVGAQVFFGRNGGTHTGIVRKYDSTWIWTVEGNTNTSGSAEGDGCYYKKHRRLDPYVYGYGYPKYDHAMDSADPDWDDEGKPPASQTGSGSSSGSSGGPARYTVNINGLDYGYGARGAHVEKVDKALIKKGCDRHHDGDGYQAGPNWTDYTTENYADHQESLGYRGDDADGVPGETSLKKLLGSLPGKKRSKSRPVVDLSRLRSAARQDPPKSGTPVSYKGAAIVEDALVAKGLLERRYADGHFGTASIAAYGRLQRSYGYRGSDADGIPGWQSLNRLGREQGFEVEH